MQKAIWLVTVLGLVGAGCSDGSFGGSTGKNKSKGSDPQATPTLEVDGDVSTAPKPSASAKAKSDAMAPKLETSLSCADFKSETEALWLTRSLYRSLAAGLDIKAAASGLAEQIALMESHGFGQPHVDRLNAAHPFLIASEDVPTKEAASAELGRIAGLLAESVLLEEGCAGLALVTTETTRGAAVSLLDAAFEEKKKKLASDSEELRLAKEKLDAMEKEKAKIAEYNVLPIPRATLVHHGDHIMADYGQNKVVERSGLGPGYRIGITVSLGCEDWKPLKIYDKWDCRMTLNGSPVMTWDKVGCVFRDLDTQAGQYCAVCEAIPGAWPAGVDLASKRTQVCVNAR